MISEATEQAYLSIVARLRSYGVQGAVIRHQVARDILFAARLSAGEAPMDIQIAQVFKKYRRRILNALIDELGLPQNRRSEALAILALEELDAGVIWLASFRSDEALKEAIFAQGVVDLMITSPKLARSTLGAPTIHFGLLQDTTNKSLALLNQWPRAKYSVFLLTIISLLVLVVIIAR